MLVGDLVLLVRVRDRWVRTRSHFALLASLSGPLGCAASNPKETHVPMGGASSTVAGSGGTSSTCCHQETVEDAGLSTHTGAGGSGPAGNAGSRSDGGAMGSAGCAGSEDLEDAEEDVCARANPTTLEAHCNKNYFPCVPDGKDADCSADANGPVYVNEPVCVIGRDVFELDADDDGIGCD
jgi:hypothetical protein